MVVHLGTSSLGARNGHHPHLRAPAMPSSTARLPTRPGTCVICSALARRALAGPAAPPCCCRIPVDCFGPLSKRVPQGAAPFWILTHFHADHYKVWRPPVYFTACLAWPAWRICIGGHVVTLFHKPYGVFGICIGGQVGLWKRVTRAAPATQPAVVRACVNVRCLVFEGLLLPLPLFLCGHPPAARPPARVHRASSNPSRAASCWPRRSPPG